MNAYRGRFAPSPTGPLHFGSLVAAVASYLDARHNDGKWLVRIEDVDITREKPGSADEILKALDDFGFGWDETVIRQSERTQAYREALERLREKNVIYPCSCSRKEIAATAPVGIEGPIYPGHCRNGVLDPGHQQSLRLRTDNIPITFTDAIQGRSSHQLEKEFGDFIVRRADGLYAYQLAVVVDDSDQRISHVVRGSDLILSTPRQIYLQKLLGLITPQYAHIPLVLNEAGKKLSKSSDAWPVDQKQPVKTLNRALEFLNHSQVETDTIDEFWKQAIADWDLSRVGTSQTQA